MSAGLGMQIERHLAYEIATRWGERPWGEPRNTRKSRKATKHRKERRRAREEPDCQPLYRRYHGYEF